MNKFAIMIAAITLTQAAFAVAAEKSTDSGSKPSSFVPHPHTKTHVYGTPIHPAIVGHSKVSHHKQTPKKRSQTSH